MAALFWILIFVFAMQPVIASRWLRMTRASKIAAIQKSRGSRVIAVIHRQESKLTSGRWTHDYPITVGEARELGLPVNTQMPQDVLDLMALFPQPVRTTVEFGPRRSPR